MPRIADQFLDCVVYLYPSVDDAEKGTGIGGSGFLVSVPTERMPNSHFVYAVSNRHVVYEGSSPVIRLNTTSGQKDILDIPQEDWLVHPDGSDVAVVILAGLKSEIHNYKLCPVNLFMNRDTLTAEDIGPGDDVFMVGRFVDHEGVQRNLPSVRFGNIAMMPWEPIIREGGRKEESFLVEMRSIGGYSGSPVFVTILPYAPRGQKVGNAHSGKGPWLLGLDWGHLFSKEPLLNSYGHPMSEGQYTRANSGMVAVVPAWKIHELLFQEAEVSRRRIAEEQYMDSEAKNGAGFALDAAK